MIINERFFKVNKFDTNFILNRTVQEIQDKTTFDIVSLNNYLRNYRF